MNLNKGISTPIAILLIVVIAAAAGVAIWQFRSPEQPAPKQAGDYTTQSACEEIGYYWYNDACHEEEEEPGEGKEEYAATSNPVVVNKDASGASASPMDVVLLATQFSGDKTSEITVKIGKREGYPAEGVNWTDTNAEINLPEGLELVEGNMNWQGDIVGDAQKEFKAKVKAVQNGEWVVEANAKYVINETNWHGDTEKFYVLVKEDEVLISDRSFTPVSPEGEGGQKKEHPACPEGHEWNDLTKECVPIEHEECPEGYTWDSNLQECVLLEHEECPEGYIWNKESQSCQRKEEPVTP